MSHDPVVIALDFDSAREADILVGARSGAEFLTVHGVGQVMRAALSVIQEQLASALFAPAL